MNYVKARARTIGDMDAEDIVSDVMINVTLRPKTAGPVENMAAYVYRSVRNKIADHYRQKTKTVSLDALEGASFLGLLADNAPQPLEAEIEKETLLKVSQAIGRLEPRQRAVLLATEVWGKTYRELSKEWNEPVGTLLSRKHRAITALRRMLKTK